MEEYKISAKEEAFCAARARGASWADAYIAGYTTSRMTRRAIATEAGRVALRPKVIARIAELCKPIAEEFRYQLREAMKDADDAMEVARKRENGGAMVSAATLKAKLCGLLVEKREIVNPSPLDGVTRAELKQLADDLRTAIASAVFSGQPAPGVDAPGSRPTAH